MKKTINEKMNKLYCIIAAMYVSSLPSKERSMWKYQKQHLSAKFDINVGSIHFYEQHMDVFFDNGKQGFNKKDFNLWDNDLFLIYEHFKNHSQLELKEIFNKLLWVPNEKLKNIISPKLLKSSLEAKKKIIPNFKPLS
ncbi:hypothetical protein [Mycoplasmopsis alligatoris]|uniref:Uncharacterized protein n=1 Tax=Mycoplasmopsis alligatoris A21JP2 TaxID=747682 RepID=D4XUW1_9BACT|nr:hypothetical protein [Mycoplasmopsis alligatoris]EFF41866.1 hypothetical protein MALL_0115 [Mycoplasmopsis alligatoris A21JP2]